MLERDAELSVLADAVPDAPTSGPPRWAQARTLTSCWLP